MSSFSIEQMAMLAKALKGKGGFTADDITKLGQYSDPEDIRDLLRGELRLTSYEKDIVRCGMGGASEFEGFSLEDNPKSPTGFDVKKILYKVFSHQENKPFNLKRDVSVFTSKFQEGLAGTGIRLYQYIKNLENTTFLNANILDFILKKEGRVPENWRMWNIAFWGTLYCLENKKYPSDKDLFVRCLIWNSVRFIHQQEIIPLSSGWEVFGRPHMVSVCYSKTSI